MYVGLAVNANEFTTFSLGLHRKSVSLHEVIVQFAILRNFKLCRLIV